ncbi:MAG: cyclic pyranopterin monophosphate synthase MoaC [Bacteroidales bacterium]|jgi:cyclic pyranopterin phosphate synthase|nr:cyclic pyranopterin monophosphate synthase MoaC [Bacteroidales bacterium]MDD4214294.1 cyclic pyranopterin monophosphate synthase MoaC [Bacteroidales bacterium]
MPKLSHTNKAGKANMVDVGHKPLQIRLAMASGKILLQKETLKLIKENEIKKGDVLTLAEVAGIQAAKQNAQLIPLCHPLMLTKVEVKCAILKDGIEAKSMVKCIGQTGVEMEALTAVSIALLTIYDMCKAVDKKMIITDIRLLSKEKKDIP